MLVFELCEHLQLSLHSVKLADIVELCEQVSSNDKQNHDSSNGDQSQDPLMASKVRT